MSSLKSTVHSRAPLNDAAGSWEDQTLHISSSDQQGNQNRFIIYIFFIKKKKKERLLVCEI